MNHHRLSGKDFFTSGELPLAILWRTPQQPFPVHTHDFFELVIIFSGKGILITDYGQYSVIRGDAFVVRDDQLHGYKNLNDLVLVNILYDQSIVNYSPYDLKNIPGFHALFTLDPLYRKRHGMKGRLRLSDEQLTRANLLIERMEEELRNKKSGFQSMTAALFMQLLCSLSRWYTELPFEDPGWFIKVGTVLSFLEEHFQEQITIGHLTSLARMSESSLTRAFRKITGSPPVDYLIKLRIRHASELLKETEKSITQVALDCGFSDSNYFSRQFKKIINTTPRQYRRNHQYHHSSKESV